MAQRFREERLLVPPLEGSQAPSIRCLTSAHNSCSSGSNALMNKSTCTHVYMHIFKHTHSREIIKSKKKGTLSIVGMNERCSRSKRRKVTEGSYSHYVVDKSPIFQSFSLARTTLLPNSPSRSIHYTALCTPEQRSLYSLRTGQKSLTLNIQHE